MEAAGETMVFGKTPSRHETSLEFIRLRNRSADDFDAAFAA
jgi:hypothetical protein